MTVFVRFLAFFKNVFLTNFLSAGSQPPFPMIPIVFISQICRAWWFSRNIYVSLQLNWLSFVLMEYLHLWNSKNFRDIFFFKEEWKTICIQRNGKSPWLYLGYSRVRREARKKRTKKNPSFPTLFTPMSPKKKKRDCALYLVGTSDKYTFFLSKRSFFYKKFCGIWEGLRKMVEWK